MKTLHTLKERGDNNNVPVELITATQAMEIEPHINTFKYALFSPTTSSVNPRKVMECLEKQARDLGIEIHLSTQYIKRYNYNTILLISIRLKLNIL